MTSPRDIPVLRLSRGGVVRPWRRRERELRRLGWNVDVLTASRWDEGGDMVTIDATDEHYVHAAPVFGSHPFLFFYDPRAILRLLRNRRYALIDAHEEPASVAVAEVVLMRALLAPGSKLVLYSAENLFKRYPFPFSAFERLALRRTSAIYVCNEAARDNLRAKNFRGAIEVIPLGVDVDAFAPGPWTEPLPGGTLRAGYVGRLTDRKGVHELLDAVSRLPWCELDFVGEGPERESLAADIATRGLQGRVRILGHRAADDLPDLYRTFDVVAVPSKPTPRWEEQFCRVAAEAMASGVPVIASRTGALPEVVGHAGVLVAAGDASQLASALERLRSHPDERRRLRELGIERAANFAWPEVARRHAHLYDAALAAPRQHVADRSPTSEAGDLVPVGSRLRRSGARRLFGRRSRFGSPVGDHDDGGP